MWVVGDDAGGDLENQDGGQEGQNAFEPGSRVRAHGWRMIPVLAENVRARSEERVARQVHLDILFVRSIARNPGRQEFEGYSMMVK